jgi:hypothetical protein
VDLDARRAAAAGADVGLTATSSLPGVWNG